MKKYCVLHVEDRDADAEIIQTLLEGASTDQLQILVDRFSTGEEAIRALELRFQDSADMGPDMILMDLQLVKEGESLLRNNLGELIVEELRRLYISVGRTFPRVEIMTVLGKHSPQYVALEKAGYRPISKADFRVACSELISRIKKYSDF